MRIARYEEAPGGWYVFIEIPNATTRGETRERRVFLGAGQLSGKTFEERLAAVREAATQKLSDILGADLDDPIPETKALLEVRAERGFATWQRWQATRVEFDRRNPAPRGALLEAIFQAFEGAENTAWSNYLAILNQWRAAP
jgi:predicted RNase H-like HicB family nuclease